MTKYESLRIMFLQSLKEVKELEDMTITFSNEVDRLADILNRIKESLDKHYNGVIKDCKVYETLLYRDISKLLEEVK